VSQMPIQFPIQIKEWMILTSQGKMNFQEDLGIVDEKKGLFVVVDGFGGRAGAQFAQDSCDSIKKFLIREARDEDATLPFLLRKYLSLAGNVLFNAMIFANRHLMKQNKTKHVYQRGGASALAGYLDEDLLAVANLGTVSIALVRDGKRLELVKPRSYESLVNPYAPNASFGIPLTALGISEDMEPEIVEVKVKSGDMLVAYTDGVKSSFIEEVVSRVSPSGPTDQEALKQLFSAQDHSDNALLTLLKLA